MALGRPYPDPKLRYRIEVDGQSVGSFSSLDGPSLSFEVLEFREGGDPTAAPKKLPGRVKWGDVVLKRGFVNRSFFENWIRGMLEDPNKVPRKNLSLVVLDDSLTEVKRYNLYNCWPSSWKSSSLDGKGSGVLTEEVVVVIEYFEEA
jgi:phage tail-like protein